MDGSTRDWTDWEAALHWLGSLYTGQELADVFGWPYRSVCQWLSGNQTPEPPRRREILCSARTIRGRLQGMESYGYALEVGAPTPRALAEPDSDSEEPALDRYGLPTGARRDAVNARLRELAAARGEALRDE